MSRARWRGARRSGAGCGLLSLGRRRRLRAACRASRLAPRAAVAPRWSQPRRDRAAASRSDFRRRARQSRRCLRLARARGADRPRARGQCRPRRRRAPASARRARSSASPAARCCRSVTALRRPQRHAHRATAASDRSTSATALPASTSRSISTCSAPAAPASAPRAHRLRAAEFDRDATALVVEADVARAFVQHAALAARIALLDRNIAQARELERIIDVRLRAGDATRVDIGLQTIHVRQLEAERLAPRRGARPHPQRSRRPGRRGSAALRADARADSTRSQAPDAGAGPAGRAARPPPRHPRRRSPDRRGRRRRRPRPAPPSSRGCASARAALGQAASLSGPLGADASDRRRPARADLRPRPAARRSRLRGGAPGGKRRALPPGPADRARRGRERAVGGRAIARPRALLLDRIVEEARLTARLARLQYIEGEADLQRLLDAEQRLVQAEDARAIARQERLDAAIDLYKAMGGAFTQATQTAERAMAPAASCPSG